MNKEFSKELKAYFGQIKKNLNCGFFVKQGFIVQFKDNVAEYLAEQNAPDLSIDDIVNIFGSPDDIAKSFDNIGDVEKVIKKGKRLLMTEAIIILAALVVIVLLAIVAYMIYVDSLIKIIVDNNF